LAACEAILAAIDGLREPVERDVVAVTAFDHSLQRSR